MFLVWKHVFYCGFKISCFWPLHVLRMKNYMFYVCLWWLRKVSWIKLFVLENFVCWLQHVLLWIKNLMFYVLEESHHRWSFLVTSHRLRLFAFMIFYIHLIGWMHMDFFWVVNSSDLSATHNLTLHQVQSLLWVSDQLWVAFHEPPHWDSHSLSDLQSL